MLIRLATPADAPAVAALAARLFFQAYGDSHNPDDLDSYIAEHFPLPRIEGELTKRTSAWFLVEESGEFIAYAELRNREPPPETRGAAALELGRFYVDAGWHGRGVAQALLDAVATEARYRGAALLWLVVWADNERAKAFYQKHGFRRVGTTPYRIGGKVYDDDLMVREV